MDELDVDPGLLAEALGEPLDRRHEPEVVQRLRAQLDGEPADVLERRADEVAHLGHRRAQRHPVLRLLEAAQAEQDRGERLARLVVELPRQPPPLVLLRAHTRRARPAPPAA